MHLPDGIIPLWQAAIYWIIVLISLGLFMFKLSKNEDYEKRILLTAVFAAVSVAVSSISIPSPFGVPMHFFLIPLVAILLGPLSGVAVAFICLLIQFLFLGMGGLTTLGGNVLTMGVALSLATYLFYKLIGDLNEKLGIFSATVMGIIMATVTQVIIFLVAGVATLEMLMATLIPFYLFIAILEGAVNILIISSISKIKPELLKLDKI